MKTEEKFILGKEYKSYGKYIGIVRTTLYGKYDYEEHRFSISRGLNETAKINSVKVDDTKMIEKILKDDSPG